MSQLACQQTISLLVIDLVLADGDGEFVGQIGLGGAETRIHLLHVGGWHKPLPVVDFHFPPILQF